MSILNVNNISYGFGDRTLFKDISFRLLRGEHVGLVGKNGEGKSTFMNIITSQLIPDSGDIQWSSKVRVGYMDQHTKLEKGNTIKDILRESFKEFFDMESEMNSIYSKMGEMNEHEINKSLEKVANIQDFLNNNEFYNIDSKIDSIALGLGFRHIGLDRDVSELSGGQRTKVLLGKLLLDEPDILLLDEPTNYLDKEHIEWLRKYLQNYENAFILISHDLEFLNSVVNVVCHLENMTLTRYIGNYENFQKMYEENKRNLRIAQEKQ
ncbi:ATP-binding cassette domain-containing protein [Clostridioides difficile]